LTIVGRIFTAAQRPELANFWAIVSSVVSVVALVGTILAGGGLAALVFAFSGSQMLVTAASAVWLFMRVYPDLTPSFKPQRSSMRKVFGVAGAFFLAQLATLMIFQSGNFIVASHLGPQFVPPYQVCWLVSLYVLVPQQLISSSIWATIGEAFAIEDLAWIRRLVKRYAIASLVVCGPVLLLMVLVGDRAIELWAGPAARPSRELLGWMATWALLQVAMQPLTAVLGGTGRLHEYAMFSIAAAVVAVVGGVVAVQHFGSTGVIASTVLSFFCLVLVPAVFLTARTLRYPQLASAVSV
jgi:O-antigen/teichoic acid export membrane protein